MSIILLVRYSTLAIEKKATSAIDFDVFGMIFG